MLKYSKTKPTPFNKAIAKEEEEEEDCGMSEYWIGPATVWIDNTELDGLMV